LLPKKLWKLRRNAECKLRESPYNFIIRISELTCISCFSFHYPASSYFVLEDSQCFLFTLVNPSGSEPIKINQKRGASVGIRCGDDLGPRFCEIKSGGNALFLDPDDTPSSFRGGLNLVNSFPCPQNAENQTFFTGRGTFDVTELEVFKMDL